MKTSSFKVRIGTITQTNHWIDKGQILAYEPYVREMRVWCDLFESIEVFTPLTASAQRGSLTTYNRANVDFVFVRYTTDIFRLGFLVRLLQLPLVTLQMILFIARHDLLLIRSPGHLAFIAHILVVLFNKRSITKFAGLFDHFPGERMPSVFERFFIRKFLTSRNVVLIYGQARGRNFISYFPLLLSAAEIGNLDSLKLQKSRLNGFKFYSLGRLMRVKGYQLAILGLAELRRLAPEFNWTYHLIGDGPEEPQLRQLVNELGLRDRVVFEGGRSYIEAMGMISNADVVIMPGVMEGWPKVIVEAWAVGAVPLCARAGLIPQIIEDGVNGFIFEPNPVGLAHVSERILRLSHNERRDIALKGKSTAMTLTVEKFSEGLVDICESRFHLVK